MKDGVAEAMKIAVKDFNGSGKAEDIFNAAGFSSAMMKLAGIRGALDGHVVRAMLKGRNDVEALSGGYYQYIPSKRKQLLRWLLRKS